MVPTFKGIQLRHPKNKGRMVVSADFVPYQGRHIPGPYPINHGHSFALLSDNGGISWRRGGANPLPTSNGCAIAELADGFLVMNSRESIESFRPQRLCNVPPHERLFVPLRGGSDTALLLQAITWRASQTQPARMDRAIARPTTRDVLSHILRMVG